MAATANATATATSNPPVDLNTLAAQWRGARRLYPVYSALLRNFHLEIEPCRELESPINRSEPEVMQRIAAWFISMDQKVEAWQLRQLLQGTNLGNEETLRALIKRQLSIVTKTKMVRDRVDFLMVQYYAQCSPHGAHEDLSFDHFADVLEPVIGEVSPLLPPFCAEFDVLLAKIDACASLGELLNGQLIDRARQIKDEAEERYFSPSVLVAVARFNYLLRLAFFRLMHADLHAVRVAIRGMEQRGQETCDCSSAGLAKDESLAAVRQLCHDWKKPFKAAYAAGSNFKQLVALRAAVEAALAAPAPAKDVAKPAAAVPAASVKPAPPVQPQAAAMPAKPVPAAQKVAPAPPAPKESSAAPADLEACLEAIAAQLINTTPKAAPVTHVAIGTTKLLLASWEVAAFVRGGDDVSDSLQRAVAARALLSVQLDAKRSGAEMNLGEAIASAHVEAAQLQERIAEAKDAKNIDAAVNLAASAKRLLAGIDEAEKARQ